MVRKKISRIYLIAGIAAVILIALFFFRFVIGSEDDWIKDSRGVWIKHGNPSTTPSYVAEQEAAINCSIGKVLVSSWMLDSQCLGTCGTYAVDIVHVPRLAEDDLEENQCEEYRNGNVSHFIELDKYANVVRIV